MNGDADGDEFGVVMGYQMNSRPLTASIVFAFFSIRIYAIDRYESNITIRTKLTTYGGLMGLVAISSFL